MRGVRRAGGRRLEFAAATSAVLFFLHLLCSSAAQSNSTSWKTLSGKAPVIIAKGGFSGAFPDSSSYAYLLVPQASSPDTILWCDVRLTKDSIGICLPNLKLDNCSSAADIYPNGKKTYLVNGVRTTGWFSVDYNSSELIGPVTLRQANWARIYLFDYSNLQILSVTDVAAQLNESSLWLNVQHDIFYRQHGLNMTDYIISVSKRVRANYISSPEVNFLRKLSGLTGRNTKLVFHVLDKAEIEPSINQTYGFLLNNLTYIKTFASGILIPKSYIWPVTDDNYILPYTSIVSDAHREGLEVYATDFANDNVISYNYSYDPLTEYLEFIDNGVFSVDGVLTDHPITPSQAVGCFTNLSKSVVDHGMPIVISHNGASGDFPDCTDLAYQKAVDDGADVIDCPIQVTKDGVLVCMSSANLMDDTTVVKSPFSSRTSIYQQFQNYPGIFTFNLTWEEINKLKPLISSPQSTYTLVRNPRYKNAGKFFRLSDFLAFAKNKDLLGVLISVTNAAFIVEDLGFDVIGEVIAALNNGGYDNKNSLDVIIQSPDSNVLEKFKQQRNHYKTVYYVKESIRDVDASSLSDIKKFADAVAVDVRSIYPDNRNFIIELTDVVHHLQTANLSVYVYLIQNEFVSQRWDFFRDVNVAINTYVKGAKINGFITDFPATPARYKRNSCRSLNTTPQYMEPVSVGGLFQLINRPAQPPAIAPMPLLDNADVVEPPLPPVGSKKPDGGNSSTSSQNSGNQMTSISTSATVLQTVGSLTLSWLLTTVH